MGQEASSADTPDSFDPVRKYIKVRDYAAGSKLLDELRVTRHADRAFHELELEIAEGLKEFSECLEILERMASFWPDEPTIVARLITALARQGELQRADGVAKAFVGKAGPDEDVDLAYALAPQQLDDLQEAYLRLADFRSRYPDSRAGFRRISDVARWLYRFDEAIATLDNLADTHPKVRAATIEQKDKISAFALAQSVSWKAVQDGDRDRPRMDLYVINMDQDIRRWDTMCRWYTRAELPIIRIGAIRARYLPTYALRRVCENPKIKVGTIGCFLSHISAWEAIQRSGRSGFVLEDDAQPLFKFANDTAAINSLDQYDICFVNERMAPKNFDPIANTQNISIVPIQEIVASRRPDQRGVGCDGYIVTPQGAQKLLNFVKIDGIIGHVDFQVLSYCVQGTDLDHIPNKGSFVEVLGSYVISRNRNHALKAGATALPFVREEDLKYSARNSEHGE